MIGPGFTSTNKELAGPAKKKSSVIGRTVFFFKKGHPVDITWPESAIMDRCVHATDGREPEENYDLEARQDFKVIVMGWKREK